MAQQLCNISALKRYPAAVLPCTPGINNQRDSSMRFKHEDEEPHIRTTKNFHPIDVISSPTTWMKWVLLLLMPFICCLTSTASAFSSLPMTAMRHQISMISFSCDRTTPASTKFYVAKQKKGKLSMAERRQRRQSKSQGINRTNPFTDLPPSKLVFTVTASTTDEETSSEQPFQDSNPIEGVPAKAQDLLKAQRESVRMLTLVKNRIIDTLTPSTVKASL
jgi:hypothetical protein